MKRILNALDKLNGGKRAYAVFVLCAATAISLPAQTFTTLYSFCPQGAPCPDGAQPSGGLIEANNGYLYGTTSLGGANCPPFGCGTVFKITPSGTLTTLYSFCPLGTPCTDGDSPNALVQATDGNFYGTTVYGGANLAGTVFKITPSGTLTTLYNFCTQSGCSDGANPQAGLIQATDGSFYGTTSNPTSGGTVFKITPSGTLTTLFNFCTQSGCPNGFDPGWGKLVQTISGDLYGTTENGGYNCATGVFCEGTVFKITPRGTLTTLYNFCAQSRCPTGAIPVGGLAQTESGDVYGTTSNGGSHYKGTVFRMNPSGSLTTLHDFCSETINCLDGEEPQWALVEATDGDFYGTTKTTVFKITPSGTLTTLHSCPQNGCTSGEFPNGRLVQGTDGVLYGVTNATVFSLSVGLGPFVKTLPTSGDAGEAVKILGSDLTGATSVSFNGTAATFTVVSRYLITTTVPTGATTGTVQVVTPGGTLSSNVRFRSCP